MKLHLLLPICCLAATLCGTELKWENPGSGRFSGRDGRRFYTLTLSPEEKGGQHCARAGIDLGCYRGMPVMLSMKAAGREVSQPPDPWNGVKLMLHQRDRNGMEYWNGTNRLTGTFGFQTVSSLIYIIPDAVEWHVMVGLQDSSGTVEFDLDSLEIRPLFDLEKAAANRYAASYSDAVRSRPAGRGVMSPKRFRPGDLEQLAAWNVNLVRFQISRNWGKSGTDRDPAEYDRWLDGLLAHLDEVLEQASKLGIAVIIDLHQPPGGRYPDNDMVMFYEKPYAEHFIAVWEKIARRFKGNPAVWGYDLINEPLQTHPARYDYLTLQRLAAEAVRKIDPAVPLIVEANEAAAPSGFRYLEPLELENVIYQVHMYLPNSYTHQLVHTKNAPQGVGPKTAFPGIIEGRRWDRAALREALRPVREFQQRHQARILVGEFSAVLWAPGAARYLEACTALFEEYGWDWTYHSFREWPGWSIEHEGSDIRDIRPSADNDRKRVLLEAFRKNERL